MRRGAGQGGVYAALLFVGIGLVTYARWQALPAPAAAAATVPVTQHGAPGAAAPAGGERELTHPQGMDGFPDWSPDGRRLVFMRDGQIWVMGADGSGARALTNQPGNWDVAPIWSPDGQRLAFIRYPEQAPDGTAARLMLLQPALPAPPDGGDRELVHDQDLMGYGAWSPDGRQLAFTTPHQLRVYDLQRRRTQVLVDLGPDAEVLPGGIDWCPGRPCLLFGANLGAGLQLYELRTDAPDQPPRQLTRAGGIMPDISPDGQRVAYRQPRVEAGIYILNLTTGVTRPLQRDRGRFMYFHPRWSPDGRRLALSRLVIRGGQSQPLISALVEVPYAPAPGKPAAAPSG